MNRQTAERSPASWHPRASDATTKAPMSSGLSSMGAAVDILATRQPGDLQRAVDRNGQPSPRRHRLRPHRTGRRGPRRDSPVSCAARLRLRRARGVQRGVDRSDHRSRERDGRGRDGSRPRRQRHVRGGALPLAIRRRSGTGAGREPSGLRHVAFKVDDVRGVADRVREAGWETVGEIVDFENTFLLCYVRGPRA